MEKMSERRIPNEPITLRSNTYQSGLTEIGCYVDEVLPKAGLVLTGTASKSAGIRHWFVHVRPGPRGEKAKNRERAEAMLVEGARKTDAYRHHAERTKPA